MDKVPSSPSGKGGMGYGKIIIESWGAPEMKPEVRVVVDPPEMGFAHLLAACEEVFVLASHQWGSHPEALVKALIENAKKIQKEREEKGLK